MPTLQLIQGTAAARRQAAANITKTRYDFFGVAGTAGNQTGSWLDESGHGNHLVAGPDNEAFMRVTDGNGLSVFRDDPVSGGVWALPFSFGVSDYTVHVLLRPSATDVVYLLDAGGHSVLLALNDTSAGAYFTSNTPHGAVNAAAGELALLTWRLSEALGGRVYKNGQLVYSGTYVKRPFNAGGALGHDYSTYFAPFLGDLHAFVFRAGNDSDAEIAEAWAYLRQKANLTF